LKKKEEEKRKRNFCTAIARNLYGLKAHSNLFTAYGDGEKKNGMRMESLNKGFSKRKTLSPLRGHTPMCKGFLPFQDPTAASPLLSLSLFAFFDFCRPESLGMIAAVVYLIVMFFYIPFHFRAYLLHTAAAEDEAPFPHDKVGARVWARCRHQWGFPLPTASRSSARSRGIHARLPAVCGVHLRPHVHMLHDVPRLC
jgi:hypothetical protein